MQQTEIIRDESLRELISHSTNRFPFRYYYEDMKQFQHNTAALHWHTEFEFVTVKKGLVYFEIGEERIPVSAGEGIFINSRILHGLFAPGEGIIPNILFAPELIAGEGSSLYETYVSCFLTSGISHLKLSGDVSWQKRILDLLDTVYHTAREGAAAYELEIHILICRLWQILYAHREDMARRPLDGLSIRTRGRLQTMLRYIEQHYPEKISLSDIADSASISRSEAIRCFQAGMHISPMACVNDYRLSRARELLLCTNDSVTEIALSVGLENCSYFDRLFLRKYGTSPRAMRRSASNPRCKSGEH